MKETITIEILPQDWTAAMSGEWSISKCVVARAVERVTGCKSSVGFECCSVGEVSYEMSPNAISIIQAYDYAMNCKTNGDTIPPMTLGTIILTRM
jgi:hypothetical protein